MPLFQQERLGKIASWFFNDKGVLSSREKLKFSSSTVWAKLFSWATHLKYFFQWSMCTTPTKVHGDRFSMTLTRAANPEDAPDVCSWLSFFYLLTYVRAPQAGLESLCFHVVIRGNSIVAANVLCANSFIIKLVIEECSWQQTLKKYSQTKTAYAITAKRCSRYRSLNNLSGAKHVAYIPIEPSGKSYSKQDVYILKNQHQIQNLEWTLTRSAEQARKYHIHSRQVR